MALVTLCQRQKNNMIRIQAYRIIKIFKYTLLDENYGRICCILFQLFIVNYVRNERRQRVVTRGTVSGGELV